MRAAVVGGGVSGLAAAYRLLSTGHDVTLCDASSRLGGHIHTVRTNGFVVEHGADGFLVYGYKVDQLLDELSLTERLVHQLTTASNALVKGELQTLEAGQAAAALGLGVDKSLTGKGTVSFPLGLGELVDRLAARVAATGTVKLKTRVEHIEPVDGCWVLETTSGDLRTDLLIVAAPPAAVAKLLKPISHSGAQQFSAIRGLSSVVVALAFRKADLRVPRSSTGFIIPGQPREREGLKACTFSSSKFAHRAPPDASLVRAYYRSGPTFPIDDDDHRWIQRAVTDLAPVLGIARPEQFGWVARWPEALYQLPKDHATSVQRIARDLQTDAPIELAGAACDGVGVSTAIASGLAAADRLCQRP